MAKKRSHRKLEKSRFFVVGDTLFGNIFPELRFTFYRRTIRGVSRGLQEK